MATRRKTPDSAGFYIALVAGGALLYLLLRKGTPGALPSDKPAIVGGGGGGGGGGAKRPTKGCHGLPFMPLDKGEQLQENLNAFFDRAGLAQCKVDGFFGNNTARLLDYYRSELAPMAERARSRPGAYTVLADASIFYDPIASDTVTFDLYQKGCDLPAFSMRKSLYDKLTSPSFAWSTNDLSAAGLTPAVAG
jgi:hypothetical protein